MKDNSWVFGVMWFRKKVLELSYVLYFKIILYVFFYVFRVRNEFLISELVIYKLVFMNILKYGIML